MFHRLVTDPRVKVVVLHRANVLDVYASKLRADKVRRTHWLRCCACMSAPNAPALASTRARPCSQSAHPHSVLLTSRATRHPPLSQTGGYIGRSLDGVPLEIAPAVFQGFANHYSSVYKYYDSLLMGRGRHSVFRVSYSDLAGADGGAAVFSELAAFLGVDPSVGAKPLRVTVRQTRAPLSEGIVNYRELKYAFSCTELAGCFVD